MQQENNPIGHNNPPSDAEALQQRLQDNNAEVLDHAQNLVEAADRIPAKIEDAETAGKAADYIKKANGAVKKIEALRVSEKEPFLSQGRVVDGFFKNVTGRLDVAVKKALKPLDEYNKEVAAAERRRRDEAARIEREKQQEQELLAAAMRKATQDDAAATMLDRATETAIVADKLEKEAEAKPAHLGHVRGESGARAALRTWWVGEVIDVESLDLAVLRHHINPEALQKAVNSFVAAGGRVLPGAKIYEKSETVVR